MKYLFDPVKDKINQEKHGVSLADAKFLEWNEALSWIDNRKDYKEVRWVSLVPMKQRLYCVVYVDMKIIRRVISLRKANIREVERYEKEIN
jgi:uncharacterized DUF497 family protein